MSYYADIISKGFWKATKETAGIIRDLPLMARQVKGYGEELGAYQRSQRGLRKPPPGPRKQWSANHDFDVWHANLTDKANKGELHGTDFGLPADWRKLAAKAVLKEAMKP